METKHEHHAHQKMKGMYKKLGIMLLLSFAAMYILMYAMVDTYANSLPNINQFYMAGLMTMPMLLIEIVVMWTMYSRKKLNITLLVLGIIAGVVFFTCIRQQTGVGDKQFLKSMVPHHGAAVLMVKQAELTDPEIKELAKNIIESQEKEIEQMKAKLKELEK